MQYIAIFDWDGTIQLGYAFSIFYELLKKKGILKNNILYRSDLLKILKAIINHDFLAKQGMKIICSRIRGISEADVLSLIEEFKQVNNQYIYPFMKDIFAFLRENNIEIIVISGSPKELTIPYQNDFGIDKIYATNYHVESGCYTGSYDINMGTSEGKESVIRELILNNDKKILFSFGDSISDIPLIQSAEVSFLNCVNSKVISKHFQDSNVARLNFEHSYSGIIILNIMKTILKEKGNSLKLIV